MKDGKAKSYQVRRFLEAYEREISKPKDYDWDGHAINLYRDEDGDWLVHLVDLPNASAFGDTPEEALDEPM